jgi:PAS domain S-box-containing protein
MPVLAFLGLAAAGVGAWMLLVIQQEHAIVAQTKAMADEFAKRVEGFFDARIRSVMVLRDNWLHDPDASEATYHRLAGMLNRQFTEIRTINWVDPEGVIRWVNPIETNRAAVGLDIAKHPVAGSALARASMTGMPAATPPLTLAQGGTGFAIYMPLGPFKRGGGFLGVVFRSDEVFPALLRDNDAALVRLDISDEDQPIVIFGPDVLNPLATASATARILDRKWKINVAFSGTLSPAGIMSQVPYALPPILMILLSALVALLVHMHLRQVEDIRSRERELRVSESRLRSFLENSPAMIVIKSLDGRYELVNSRVQDWLGISQEQAIGRLASDFFEIETANGLVESDIREVTSGRTQTHEHRKIFADGEEHILVGTKFPILGQNGMVTGIGSIINDVTEQRQAEDQLRQVQKMEAVGNMTGGLAHDFNNLLTIILGNLQLLERRLKGDEASMAESAVRAARGASEVTHRLLAFSRRHPLAPERVDLASLAEGLRGLLSSALGQGFELRIELEQGLWDCYVDQGQLESALVNLAINARDAMPDGGTVTISMENVEDAEAADPESRRQLRITVADTGIGMPKEVLDRAVNPFFTTKPGGQGTGLRLSMVYGFANQSGGALHIESRPGQGTRVIITLPRAEIAGAQADNAA